MKIQSATPTRPMQVRPIEEGWTVEQTSFSSTQDLVERLGDLPSQGIPATYQFKRKSQLSDNSRVLRAAEEGAFTGGAVGLVGSLGLLYVGGFLSALGGTTSSLLGPVTLVVATALGAVIGGVAAGTEESKQRDWYLQVGERVPGVLQKEKEPGGQTSLAFFPRGLVDEKINLDFYAKSPVETGEETQMWWQ